MGFKLYEVEGYPRPLRLSEEHAKALGGRLVDEERVRRPVAEPLAPESEAAPVEDDGDEEWS